MIYFVQPEGRPFVLQWHDPQTGKRKSKTAGTSDYRLAEQLRAELQKGLNEFLNDVTVDVTPSPKTSENAAKIE
jgi:hypothetical protein